MAAEHTGRPSPAELFPPLAPELPCSEVIARLKAGERRRKRHVFALRPKRVAARFFPEVLRRLMHIPFAVPFVAAIEMVIQISRSLVGADSSLVIFRGLGLPAGIPSLLWLPVLGFGCGVLGFALLRASERLQPWATRYRAIIDQLSRTPTDEGIRELQDVIERGMHFSLYLRSFGGEYFRYERRWADFSVALDIREIARASDSRLIRLIAAQSRCFALANLDDPSPPIELTQLFVLNEHWPSVVDSLLRRANCIFIYLSDASSGLRREMGVISCLKLEERTLVILASSNSDEDESNTGNGLLDGFPNQVREDADNLEEVIAAFTWST